MNIVRILHYYPVCSISDQGFVVIHVGKKSYQWLECNDEIFSKIFDFLVPVSEPSFVRTSQYPLLMYDTQLLCFLYRSSRPEVFLRKGVLKLCSKFTGKHPCRSVMSIKLFCKFRNGAF